LFNMTPLDFAATRTSPRITEMLLQAGANVNGASPFGWTPLHHACRGGEIATIRVLVENGADLYATSSDNQSTA
ncbi:ankyrin repeat-containing domain protein, partial [Baffinella frigidus]